MLVFIDESWDSWLKLWKWSSEFFTVWMVVFNDYEEAEKCDKWINELKKELWKAQNYEFHFRWINCSILMVIYNWNISVPNVVF